MFVLLFEKELMNWLSLRTPNVVSSFFTYRSSSISDSNLFNSSILAASLLPWSGSGCTSKK